MAGGVDEGMERDCCGLLAHPYGRPNVWNMVVIIRADGDVPPLRETQGGVTSTVGIPMVDNSKSMGVVGWRLFYMLVLLN